MSFMTNISIECKGRQISLFKRVLFLHVVAIAVRHRGETHEGDTHEGETHEGETHPLLFICKVFLKKIVKGHLIDLKNFYSPLPPLFITIQETGRNSEQ